MRWVDVVEVRQILLILYDLIVILSQDIRKGFQDHKVERVFGNLIIWKAFCRAHVATSHHYLEIVKLWKTVSTTQLEWVQADWAEEVSAVEAVQELIIGEFPVVYVLLLWWEGPAIGHLDCSYSVLVSIGTVFLQDFRHILHFDSAQARVHILNGKHET